MIFTQVLTKTMLYVKAELIFKKKAEIHGLTNQTFDLGIAAIDAY